MASPEHPGSPGWTGPITQCTARTKQEAPATGPDLPHLGPDGHLDTHSGLSSNSSMTTRELQQYWQNEKCHWKHVKLLFEIASARIEERKVSKFVMGKSRPGEVTHPGPQGETGTAPGPDPRRPRQSDMLS
uniref:Sorting nexin 20 n=1 Tax=Aotus nancymaae TaxID=37293 RepID=A0A2K5E720_AOTNA